MLKIPKMKVDPPIDPAISGIASCRLQIGFLLYSTRCQTLQVLLNRKHTVAQAK